MSNPCLHRLSHLELASLGNLRRRLQRKLALAYSRFVPVSAIRSIIDEAVCAVAGSGFPHLLLPVLAEEKVRHTAAARQSPS